MKKTDRDKDWPIVNGLGQRLWRSGDPFGLLHITDLDLLQQAWDGLDSQTRQLVAQRRPLLKCLSNEPALTRPRFDLLLLVERLVWERVNSQRYSRYTRSWKSFYRSWRRQDLVWPTNESFDLQHARLLGAARRHGLPQDPLAAIPPAQLVQTAVEEILAMERFTQGDVAAVLPRVYELLP